jgi:hypothetical protein
MPTLTYNYVYFAASGPHQRQPTRTPGGPGGFNLIQTIPGGTLASGDQFVLGAQPATQMVGTQTYNFGFVNISGGTPSGQISLESNTPPPLVQVGSAPIVVLVVYVPVGGGSKGPSSPGSGATIDSFDETTGSLFNDTFVSVSPDPGGTLTHSGNFEGYVDTTNAETIAALSPTSPTGVDFDQWVLLAGDAGASIAKANLTVSKGDSVIALAFYKAPPPPPPAEVACNDTVQDIQQRIKDKGPLFTPAEWAAVQKSLANCIKEGYVTQAQSKSLIAGYKGIALSP